MSKPLSGVKVVELATFVAAPSCGRLLADLGAEVIKVESPKGDTWRGTGTRYVPGHFTADNNPVFDIYNAGKHFVALNLKDEQGKEAMMKLLEDADVFLTNTRPAALKRLGLSYEDIQSRCPKIIYASLLGYGEKGPDAAKPAFDSVAFWSRSGFLYDQQIKSDNFAPINPPFGMGDTVSGYLLLAEICAALYRRKETGEGDVVNSSLFHNGLFVTGTMSIINQKPFGRNYPVTRVGHGVPGGMYRCSDDNWVYVGTSSNNVLIPLICKAIGRPELFEDPAYFRPDCTIVDANKVYEAFRDAFLTKPSNFWLQQAEILDFPMMLVNRYSTVQEDEQAWANDYLERVTSPSGEVNVMPSSPIEMRSVGKLETIPAAQIGADTRRVLADLGYSEAQIEAMLEAGAAK